LVPIVVLEQGATLPPELAAAVRDIAGDVEIAVAHGRPSAEIIAVCAADDLLVVGSRGRSPFAGLVLGSVSRVCLLHAPCSVVVVRTKPQPGRQNKIIVGLDGSPNSRAAMVAAGEEARRRGAVLFAVHAVAWDRLGVELALPDDQLVAWARDAVAKDLAQTGVHAQTVVVKDHPSEVLVGFSADADLLVMGARGQHPVTTLLIGSTTDYCVRQAQCPVMVIRPTVVRPAEE
jgi:nucleotide-binding universal stress UspA family protein